MSPSSSASSSSRRDAKEKFKRLIIEHKGDADHEDVKEALDELVQLAKEERNKKDRARRNKEKTKSANTKIGQDDGNGDDATTEVDNSWSPAQSMEMNTGQWRAITTPPFPGKIVCDNDTDGKSRFTLGRMSFNMFKPTKLICAIEDIINIIRPIDASANEGNDSSLLLLSDIINSTRNASGDIPAWTQTYHIQVTMDIEMPTMTTLPAKLTNYGFCFPEKHAILGVKFCEGKLEPGFDMSCPDNAALATVWKETFDCAITKESYTQSYLSRAGTWLIHKVMYMLMGLEPPSDSVDYTQTYKIGRPYVGQFEFIYIDKDLRVTKGNRGTIVVVERVVD
jgi:hypothetical protein